MRREKVKEPPKQFFEFISVLNSLDGAYLPAYSELMKETEKIDFDHPSDAIDSVTILLFKIVEKYPVLYEYLAGTNNPPSNDYEVESIVAKYAYFQQDRQLLFRIIDRLKQGKKDEQNRIWLGIESFPATFLLNERGEIEVQPIVGKIFNNTDLTRIRVCVVCERNIFWAKRSDAKYCSKKCSNRISVKNHLSDEENRSTHNERRRENYYYKNKIIFCETCVHPIDKCECSYGGITNVNL